MSSDTFFVNIWHFFCTSPAYQHGDKVPKPPHLPYIERLYSCYLAVTIHHGEWQLLCWLSDSRKRKMNITWPPWKQKDNFVSWKFISLTDDISWVNTRSTVKPHRQQSIWIHRRCATPRSYRMSNERTVAGPRTHHHNTVRRSEKWGGVFPRLVWHIQNITANSSWKPRKSSGAFGTEGITWHTSAEDANGFDFSHNSQPPFREQGCAK